jgi:hypothetical protein
MMHYIIFVEDKALGMWKKDFMAYFKTLKLSGVTKDICGAGIATG